MDGPSTDDRGRRGGRARAGERTCGDPRHWHPATSTGGSAATDSVLFSGVAPFATASALGYAVGGRTGSRDVAKAGPNGRVPYRRGLRMDVSTGATAVSIWDAPTFPSIATGWELVARLAFPPAAAAPTDFAVVPANCLATQDTLGAIFQVAATGSAGGTSPTHLRLRRLRVTV